MEKEFVTKLLQALVADLDDTASRGKHVKELLAELNSEPVKDPLKDFIKPT